MNSDQDAGVLRKLPPSWFTWGCCSSPVGGAGVSPGSARSWPVRLTRTAPWSSAATAPKQLPRQPLQSPPSISGSTVSGCDRAGLAFGRENDGTPREALIHQMTAEAGSACEVSEMLREGGGRSYGLLRKSRPAGVSLRKACSLGLRRATSRGLSTV